MAYYFGGRPGLLRAMIDRHLEALEAPRRELFARSDSLLGDVRSLVVPVTEALASLPQPTWRARFLSQVTQDPATAQLLRESAEQAPAAAEVFASLVDRLHAIETLDHDETAARVSLMTNLVISSCADIERRSDAFGHPAGWAEAGRFLSDAIAGMLTGPVTPH